MRGTGTFIQSGGTVSSASLLRLGFGGGSPGTLGHGTYVLNSGVVTTSNEELGYAAAFGHFIQNGGSHTVQNTLKVGSILGFGTFDLSGGTLSTGSVLIGSGGS